MIPGTCILAARRVLLYPSGFMPGTLVAASRLFIRRTPQIHTTDIETTKGKGDIILPLNDLQHFQARSRRRERNMTLGLTLISYPSVSQQHPRLVSLELQLRTLLNAIRLTQSSCYYLYCMRLVSAGVVHQDADIAVL